MYSGSTISAYSGRLLGAHQKIDRLAHKKLNRLIPNSQFPGVKAILHFEGQNGPDAIKRKSPAKDEPWHYMQPNNPQDTQLVNLIENHYKRLVKALRAEDKIRASFEAAWLSHAIVDGLTPAHHYPYEEKLVELRCGRGIDDRTSIGKKLIMPGVDISHLIQNNWRMWGPKGLFTTHAAFEAGVAILIAPARLCRWSLTPENIQNFKDQSIAQWFRSLAQDVANLQLYNAFYESGWTIPLARRIRQQLTPTLVQAVALAWYGAAKEAGLVSEVA
ncbi:MAG TPA: hypothetical protein VLF79_03790 [Candidatus Saccharimonadales bacterium]|nr:hypothetical protein [Candidatus Saccharimonadales bacterium]